MTSSESDTLDIIRETTTAVAGLREAHKTDQW